MKRLVHAIAAAIVALLVGLIAQPAVGAPSSGPSGAYTYDGHHTPAHFVDAACERGPPKAYDHHVTADAAVDYRSGGASTCLELAEARVPGTYTNPAALALASVATTTMRKQVARSDVGLLALGQWRVAANTGPRVWTNLAPKDPLYPGRTVPLDRLSSINGRFQYVVGQDGRLIVGRGGHIDLARGSGVTAAGEVRVVNGEVRMLNNSSGHYQPDASIQGIAQTAFENAGLIVRNGAWQAVTH